MFKTIDDLLSDIDIEDDKIRDFLYEISNKDLKPTIDSIKDCQKKMVNCGMCMTSKKLNEVIDVQFKVLSFLQLISDRKLTKVI